jgi:hypothetical protein
MARAYEYGAVAIHLLIFAPDAAEIENSMI